MATPSRVQVKQSNRDRERRRCKNLDVLLGAAKKYREGQIKNQWEDSLKWFKGDQYLYGKRTDMFSNAGKTDTITNLIFAHIMTMVPFLANRVPSIAAKPINPEMEPLANELAQSITRTLLSNDIVDRQEEMVLAGALFGKGYWKITWDDDRFMGSGDLRIRSVDTRNIYLEPGKMSIYESNMLFETFDIDKLTLLRMYPKHKDDIIRIFQNPDANTTGYSAEAGEESGVGLHAAAPGEAPRTTSENYVFDTAQHYEQEKRTVELKYAWFHDEGQVEISERMVEGQMLPKIVRAYPTGRLIVYAGDVVLEDRPNPYSKFPYIEYFNYDIPGMPYGMNETCQLQPLQLLYNLRQNQLHDALDHSIGRRTYYDHRANLDPDQLTNEPNEHVPVDSVEGIKIVDPPSIPPAAFETLNLIRSDMEYISGVNEVTRGSAPGDVRSGYAIEQLQSSSANRMKMKTRSLERAVREACKFITTIMGASYEKGDHYNNHVDMSGVDPEGFQFEVRAGVNLPQSRMSETQFYQWAYSEGIVDEKFIVDHSDIAEKNKLIERVKPQWEAKRQQRVNAGQPAPPA